MKWLTRFEVKWSWGGSFDGEVSEMLVSRMVRFRVSAFALDPYYPVD